MKLGKHSKRFYLDELLWYSLGEIEQVIKCIEATDNNYTEQLKDVRDRLHVIIETLDKDIEVE